MNILPSLFRRKKVAESAKAASEHPVADRRDQFDPLEAAARYSGDAWPEERQNPMDRLVSIDAYPVYDPKIPAATGVAMDEAVESKVVSTKATDDDSTTPGLLKGGVDPYSLPPALMDWYNSQGFIGYQACAIIAQHWLVDKACSQAGEDAARNGWELKVQGSKLKDEIAMKMDFIDKQMKIKENLTELNRFRNVFGIRVAIFVVDSDDPDYYEKPFNIDGVKEGSYRGISQVDPYWMTPLMTSASTLDPGAIHFYEPEFWVISGQRYHRSHLVISRGPQPADILKPTYIFGGIPLTQRIYERVYASERTANEAPLLAMNKRTTALYVDMDKAIANEKTFMEKIARWVRFRDNHAVKLLGKGESIEQHDTSLADFDSVIMTQYQLVASIARTPSTKLLGTSPKGFNATGEFEMVSYHEELESIQRNVYDPLLARHYLIAAKSEGLDVELQVVWESVDAQTAKERADLNLTKAQTDQIYLTAGAVSPDEIRTRIKDDKRSGFNSLSDEEAEQEMGMSPEAIAELEKAGAEEDKAGAAQASVEAGHSDIAGATPSTSEPLSPGADKDVAQARSGRAEQMAGIIDALSRLSSIIGEYSNSKVPEGQDVEFRGGQSIHRTVQPGTIGAERSIAGINEKVPQRDPSDLWKIKTQGIVSVIENPRGSIRQAKDGSFQQKMPHHYGYLPGTKGADGDEMDVFVGPNLKSKSVFIVHQKDKAGAFDEHKCMLGFDSAADAQRGYLDSYAKGWDGMGPVVEMDINRFRAWLKGDTTKPLVKV